MRHLDLFSGIGGFALAARWAGIETIAFCEKDKFCWQVLKKHWPDIPLYPEIKFFPAIECDLLTAGMPCQPFSIAGKKKGKDDDRYLWPETFRIIRESKPRWILLENVPGIIPHLDSILEDLENEDYAWWTLIVPASLIGAPHKRERVWIIANRDGERCDKWSDNRQKRSIQDDIERHIEKIQSEWPQFVPESWASFDAQNWLISNTNGISGEQTHKRAFTEQKEWDARAGYSRQHWCGSPKFNWEKDQPPIPGVDDGLPNGLDRNKALGNAIVPQIAYIFMKAILAIDEITDVSCGTKGNTNNA